VQLQKLKPLTQPKVHVQPLSELVIWPSVAKWGEQKKPPFLQLEMLLLIGMVILFVMLCSVNAANAQLSLVNVAVMFLAINRSSLRSQHRPKNCLKTNLLNLFALVINNLPVLASSDPVLSATLAL
jgi:hypothetical protein